MNNNKYMGTEWPSGLIHIKNFEKTNTHVFHPLPKKIKLANGLSFGAQAQ